MASIKYRAFIKVAELGSFTAAAKAMGYSQPGLHHMLASLEKELGFPLLIRSKDSITCTEEGKKALYFCYQIVKNEDYLKETAASIQGLLFGSVRVGAYNSLLAQFVPDVICRFSEVYSNISIYINEYSYSQFHDVLPKQAIDLGFMNESVPERFEFIPLFDDPAVLIMSDKHPFASYDVIPVNLLNGCSFLTQSPGFDDILEIVYRKKLFTPKSHIYVASDVATYRLVAQNVGVSIISKLQTYNLPDGVLAKPLDVRPCRHLGIAIRSSKYCTPAVKEFIRVAKQTAVIYKNLLDAPAPLPPTPPSSTL